MIVRHLSDLDGTARDVQAETWRSQRLILADDGVGFSLHDTVLHEGTTTEMWYRNHVEAVFCIEGEGTLQNLDNGEVHPITPGTMYLLDQHDRHRVTATTRLRMVCVFNPPCTGREVHDEDGSYPLPEPETAR